ncbi:MFS transporter [Comamonas sp. GB3 AK4-5]|uniref:MFS transporter n=1 Tax=Comamonas sp. GB3 AK4-5 TaxID=3231487 RepID=UPI00351F6B2A
MTTPSSCTAAASAAASVSAAAVAPTSDRLPLAALLALAMAGFLALMTETLPAGMLLPISADLQITPTQAGQLVTAYAVGALVAAVPLTAATLGWRRRPLLLVALSAILVFNSVTAWSSSYGLVLAARLLAGMATGLIWGMLAGYARRLVPPHLAGRALAISGVGAPLAMALGVPLGAWLGAALGWRASFAAISLLALLVMAWITLQVPDSPGQAAQQRKPLRQVWRTAGVRTVLAVLVLWVLAHNMLYTYVMPLVAPAGLAEQVGKVLLVFGLASMVGLGLSGLWIDRMLRRLSLVSLAGFAAAVLVLAMAGGWPAAVYLAVALWGLSFGGAAPLLQTASAQAAGEGADVAQSLLVTAWNLAIAAGGLAGGLLLQAVGIVLLPWVALALIAVACGLAWAARAHGFPARA